MPYPIASIILSVVALFAVAALAGRWLAQAGFPLPAFEARMGCIDGLRGYLALSVLAHHFVMWMQVTRLGGGWGVPTVPLFNAFGSGAVGLFFMITGFVFYRRVLTGWRQTPWSAVYITRIFRILPLVTVSVVAVAAVAMHRSGHALGRSDVPALLSWITSIGEPSLAGDAAASEINAGVLWTLRFEWAFYLVILPGLAVATDLMHRRLPSAVLPAALLAAALVGGMTHLWVTLMSYLPHFAVGMLAYEARRIPAIASRLRGRTAAVVAVTLLFLTCLRVAFPVGVGLPAFALFFICVACGNDFFGLLRSRGALVLGELSFSLYLLHAILLSLFFVEAAPLAERPSVGLLPIAMPLLGLMAILVSCATYTLVERPAMRFGRRLADQWTGLRAINRPSEVEVAP